MGIPLHQKYRPDIDGLRAIAVLSIVIFHGFPDILPGGYIGVDVFFVISGFLISSIIFKNLDNSSFSFLDFYSRRIRRIFPTLILVLVFSYLVGWLALFAVEYELLGKHITAGASFISNLISWQESGYFDVASDQKPLLHLWSLAVEEQFYVIWPMILWGTYKWNRRYLIVIWPIFLVSFTFNIFDIYSNPIAAFYSPITRFWELLMGAFIAYIDIYRKNLNSFDISQPIKNSISILGIFLILIGNFFLNKDSLFPGWWALAPTLGAVFLIFSGESAWINKKVLSKKLLVWIGLISYPLYLWHWPLLSFGRIISNGNPSIIFTCGLILSSVLLAFISYKYYELPIRKLKLKTTIALIASLILIGCAGYSVYQRKGLEFRHYTVLKGYSDKTPHSDQECLDRFAELRPDFCNLSKSKNRLDTVIIGDSVAHNLYSGMAARFNLDDRGLAMAGWPGRQPWIKTKNDSNYEHDLSEQMNALIYAMAADNSIKQVVLSMKQPSAITTELNDQINHTIQFFKDSGKHVLYIYSPPVLTFSPISCFGMPPLRQAINQSCIQEVNQIPSEYFSEKNKLKEIFTNLKIPTYDPYQFICDSQVCNIKRDSMLLYRTNIYLSIQGSEFALKNAPTRW
jgi:peptidoglycan/LPS O-acetylase OafA/YrhL